MMEVDKAFGACNLGINLKNKEQDEHRLGIKYSVIQKFHMLLHSSKSNAESILNCSKDSSDFSFLWTLRRAIYVNITCKLLCILRLIFYPVSKAPD